MKIGNVELENNIFLAPMAGVTDMEEYGKLTGMAMPLIFFPALVTTSLATTLVPAISESMPEYYILEYRMM